MKKIILILAGITTMCLSANAQGVTQKNVPATTNAMAKWSGASQLTNSSLREPAAGTFSTSTGTMTLNGVIVAQPTSTTTTGTVLQAVGSGTAAPQLFKVRNDGAIFTGTVQGVSTSSFVAGSNTITVKNGIITNIQ